MAEEFKHTILFVDDEQAILKALQRVFRRQNYEVVTAQSGKEGLEALKNSETPISMIVSDQRMPEMTGSEFLEKSKAIYPDAIRFLLTGYSDVNAIVDSINKGEIHKYITKPWNDDELILMVKQGLQHYSLVAENKRLLEVTREQNRKLFEFGQQMDKKVKEHSQKYVEAAKAANVLNKELELNLFNTVRAFAALHDMSVPYLKGHSKRVGRVAVKIAEQLGFDENEINQIELASLVHDIGKVSYSDKMQRTMTLQGLNDHETMIYKNHSEEGQNVIAFVNRLDNVGLMVRHHHERFDGKGFPDGLEGENIPIGARIIAVADVYDRICMITGHNKYLETYLSSLELTPDHLTEKEQVHNAAVEYIRKQSFTQFDPDVVKAFLSAVEDKGIKAIGGTKVAIEDITVGMVVQRTLYTKNGRFLIPHNTKLDQQVIDKLKVIHTNNELADFIHII